MSSTCQKETTCFELNDTNVCKQFIIQQFSILRCYIQAYQYNRYKQQFTQAFTYEPQASTSVLN